MPHHQGHRWQLGSYDSAVGSGGGSGASALTGSDGTGSFIDDASATDAGVDGTGPWVSDSGTSDGVDGTGAFING